LAAAEAECRHGSVVVLIHTVSSSRSGAGPTACSRSATLTLSSATLTLNCTTLTLNCCTLGYSAERLQIQRLSGGERRTLRSDRPPRVVRFSEGRTSSTLGRIRAGLDVRTRGEQNLDRLDVV